MSGTELIGLVDRGDLEGFEARCLEQIESRALDLGAVAEAFRRIQARGLAGRVETLAQMVLEAVPSDADPQQRLALAVALLDCYPDSAAAREAAVAAYRAVYGGQPGLEALLRASGLGGERAARLGLRLLDVCLPLREGSVLISRSDGRAAVVAHIDPGEALYTLRCAGRTVTLSAGELASEYEAAEEDDFRVLKQLHPERLSRMAAEDPVGLVINLLHAHGEALDADALKAELVPRVIGVKEWSGWWTRARAALKRSPNVIIEGRSPVVLRYTRQAVTLEDETRQAFEARDDAAGWLATVEGYLKEKRRRQEAPDGALLAELSGRLRSEWRAARVRRPSEALALALVLDRLAGEGLPVGPEGSDLAVRMLRDADDPGGLIAGLAGGGLWEAALDALTAARPADGSAVLAGLLDRAPEAALDRIAAALQAAGRIDDVQQHVDRALADPAAHAELVAWLWRGPACEGALRLPRPTELLATVLGALSALVREHDRPAEEIKRFRARMKSALASRGYARFRACVEQIDEASAVTMRRQIERMEGLGDNVPVEMAAILRERHPQLWKVAAVEPWDEADVVWTTRTGLERQKALLDEIVNVKLRENAKAIGRAAEHGDLSENSEYKFALEERDLLRARVAQINEGLAKARVFERGDVPADRVGIGSCVTIVDAEDGTRRVLTFMGPWDADVERGVYNYQAPVARKLMGCRVGDRVILPFEGKERTFVVQAIENGFDRLAAREGAAGRPGAPLDARVAADARP